MQSGVWSDLDNDTKSDHLPSMIGFSTMCESIFRRDEEYFRLNAHINLGGKDILLETGYKEGADELVRCAVIDNTKLDSLIYPILYLYRHYIEVSIKYILWNIEIYLGERHHYKTSHNLMGLWRRINKLSKNLPLELQDILNEEIDLDVINRIIEQFMEHDPKSDSFRYTKDGKGMETLAKFPSPVGVRLLCDEMTIFEWHINMFGEAVLQYIDGP